MASTRNGRRLWLTTRFARGPPFDHRQHEAIQCCESQAPSPSRIGLEPISWDFAAIPCESRLHSEIAISTLILNSYRRFTVLAGVESDSAGDIDFSGHAFPATDAAQWH